MNKDVKFANEVREILTAFRVLLDDGREAALEKPLLDALATRLHDLAHEFADDGLPGLAKMAMYLKNSAIHLRDTFDEDQAKGYEGEDDESETRADRLNHLILILRERTEHFHFILVAKAQADWLALANGSVAVEPV
jgi:hypothetical protein